MNYISKDVFPEKFFDWIRSFYSIQWKIKLNKQSLNLKCDLTIYRHTLNWYNFSEELFFILSTSKQYLFVQLDNHLTSLRSVFLLIFFIVYENLFMLIYSSSILRLTGGDLFLPLLVVLFLWILFSPISLTFFSLLFFQETHFSRKNICFLGNPQLMIHKEGLIYENFFTKILVYI